MDFDKKEMDLMSISSTGKIVEFIRDRVTWWLKTLRTVESGLNVWIKFKKLDAIRNDIFEKKYLHDDTKRFE